MRPARGVLALSLVASASLGLALPAAAHPITALSPQDVRLYTTAFDAAQNGDDSAADQALSQVSDRCLVGEVRFLELTHDKAHNASYRELTSWLKSFGDRPGAGRVYKMAMQVKPADALPPAPLDPLVNGAAASGPIAQSHEARDAYFSGDVTRALKLARADGDAWIAGLAAYRLGDYVDSMASFGAIAANPAEEDGTRAAGGFWAARAAVAAGMSDRAKPFLKIAAARPNTFYGMIAARELKLNDDPLGQLIDAADHGKPIPAAFTQLSYTPGHPESAIEQLVRTNPRAHRAVALMQLSRSVEAGDEIRAGMAEAPDRATRALWVGLMYELNPQTENAEISLSSALPAEARTVYPTPDLNPTGGFTVSKALVYAVAWQESRFNSSAVSPVGAVGMMQLMPPSAAYVEGDPSLKSDPISLFDAGKNLAVGQAYLTYLEQHAADYDILRTVAAYNGGPAALQRTEALLGPGADSLMVIESMPAAETRNYVRKVMAAYWSYRRQFGAPARTLDAAASGQPVIDARLDQTSPSMEHPQTDSGPAREALEILLHRDG